MENWGEEAYEEILDLCPLQTKEPFVGPGTYPDMDLFTIATTAAERIGVTLPDALRAFGRFAFPHLAGKFPAYTKNATDAKSFLLGVDSVIHVEVRKLMPEAVTPSFEYSGDEAQRLNIRYQSKRKLCFFMEGLLDGLGDHFGSALVHKQTCCMHEGADHCDFEIQFEAREIAA